MNQTRTFLLMAWLMVAFLLWREWGNEHAATPPAIAQTTPQAGASAAAAVPTDVYKRQAISCATSSGMTVPRSRALDNTICARVSKSGGSMATDLSLIHI